MVNNGPAERIKNVNLGVFYRSKLTGALVLVKMNSGSSLSIKFVFRKQK